MSLEIPIDGKIAIPTRAISYIIARDISPEMLAKMLAHCDDFHDIYIKSYHLKSDGSHHELRPKEWNECIIDLEMLAKKLRITKPIENEARPEWRDESMKCLYPATFIWRADLEVAYKKFGEFVTFPMGRIQREDDLDFNAYVNPSLESFVFEGFFGARSVHGKYISNAPPPVSVPNKRTNPNQNSGTSPAAILGKKSAVKRWGKQQTEVEQAVTVADTMWKEGSALDHAAMTQYLTTKYSLDNKTVPFCQTSEPALRKALKEHANKKYPNKVRGTSQLKYSN